MMKYSMLLIALVMLLLPVSNCFGDEEHISYLIDYNAGTVLGGCSIGINVIGIPDASIGYDGETPWGDISEGVGMLIRKVKGEDNWNGDTGWYGGDMREPLTPGHNVTIDNIYVWAMPGTTGSNIYLWPNLDPFPNPGWSYSLSLVSIPQGINYTGLPTTWGPETSAINLPFYSTYNGETGYKFQMNVFAVPEPSPLIALMGALICTGKIALLRRRNQDN